MDPPPGPTGFRSELRAALRRTVATRSRRWLLAVTLLLGVLAAGAVLAGTPPERRTFAGLAEQVQLLMSVPVPFIGALLTGDLRRSAGTARRAPTVLAALLVAVAVGAYGVLVGAGALALAPSGGAPDAWRYAGTIALGGLLVQVVAQFVGTGAGLVLRPFPVAALATVVLPLGLWLLLGAVDVLRPAQEWLTPYANARHLLSGEMSALRRAQCLTVLLLWAALPHTLARPRRP
ncbi:hypothetical protein [Micromonospora auratinigra]|uniref:ABC-2 family transporter protein n=1 Tax=Micromonospora auratinigra TaxID=261654 RepID=A0A1A8ZWD1_9ACTN|nr:hypothetical protein [Micromonospora auratinigra]SBT48147.1 hypothetical protein GA0070611_3968 [Micromonospora auratinigra]